MYVISVCIVCFSSSTMDPPEILNVGHHSGGKFIGICLNLDYVGGDYAISEIGRDKLSLCEVRGYLRDRQDLKESMKFYFQPPRKELLCGLVFLNDDTSCVKMADYTCVEAVAYVFVVHYRDEYTDWNSSGSDFHIND